VAHDSRPSGGDPSPFQSPPWDAPLDVEREIERIPVNAQIRGMFIAPVLQGAKRAAGAGSAAGARDRYVPFQFYPLREHARLLVDTSALAFPKLPVRQGLRKLGRGAPDAFLASRLGRVVLQTEQGLLDIVNGLAKAYELCLNPGRASVQQIGERAIEVTLEHVHYFLDCHHVGVFEGAFKHAGMRGDVRLHRIHATGAVLRLEW